MFKTPQPCLSTNTRENMYHTLRNECKTNSPVSNLRIHTSHDSSQALPELVSYILRTPFEHNVSVTTNSCFLTTGFQELKWWIKQIIPLVLFYYQIWQLKRERRLLIMWKYFTRTHHDVILTLILWRIYNVSLSKNSCKILTFGYSFASHSQGTETVYKTE